MGLFKKLNLPNKLTLCRFIGVLIIVVLGTIDYYFHNQVIVISKNNIVITWTRISILVMFLLCSYTDHLDGKIARANNQITTFGKFADPIADKSLNNTLFILLAVFNEMSLLVPVLFILRDTIVDGVRLVAAEKNKVLAASFAGKFKTVLQVVLAAYYLIAMPFSLNLPILNIIGIVLSILTILASIISGIEYLYKNKELILEGAK